VRTLAIDPGRPVATAWSRGGVVAELPPTRTAGYAMVGVTWRAGTAAPGTEVLVSSRTDGTWTGYEPLDVEDQPGAAAGAEARGGTEPLWVDGADGIAVRVRSQAGRAPADLEVTTVDPARTPTPSAASASGSAPGAPITGPVAFPSMPDVITRREWGADPDLGDACWAPRYGNAARAVVVHHTVNANDYGRNDVTAIMKSIQAYHTQGQGWCDIGYNYLVDRFGRIYEGRAGGLRYPVRGAHAGDYNNDTVGISMIGDYDSVRLTRRLKNAMVRLVGWRLGTSYMPIYGRTRVFDQRVPRILGHRDVMSTTCPGRYGYAFLPELRKRVHRYLSGFDSPIRERARELGRDVTGKVFMGQAWRRGGFVTRFNGGQMMLKQGFGPHWLSGPGLRAFRRTGGVYGPMGYPWTDLKDTVLRRVDRAMFEGGGLYVVRGREAHALYGRAFTRWSKLGGLSGPLGAPTSSVVVHRNGRERVSFQHGRIVWNPKTNRIKVKRS